MKKTFATMLLFAAASTSFAQNRQDAATYAEPPKNEFYENIQKKNKDFFKQKPAPVKRLTMDYANVEVPLNMSDFKIVTADKPVSQGITGTCWCFSTTSFYESEAARLGKPDVQLSEIYTVYWEYVEKAKEFVKTRGESIFDEGSETNAVQRMMKKYGTMPLADYTGMKAGQPFHDHSKMIGEMRKYLKGVKERGSWNTEEW